MKKSATNKIINARIKKIVENVKFKMGQEREKIMVRIYGKYYYAKINRITPKGVWANVPCGERGHFVEKWIGNARTWTPENFSDFLLDWKKNHERRLNWNKTADVAKGEFMPSVFFDQPFKLVPVSEVA